MVRSVWLQCVTASLLLVSVCSADFYPKKTRVQNMDADNFDRLIGRKNSIWMVEFYAPWCGHCKALQPTWIKAAKKLHGVVGIGAVNADESQNKQLAGKYGIQGFPTIKVFINGTVTDYNGGRDFSDIVSHAHGLLPNDLVMTVTAENDKDEFQAKEDDLVPRVLVFSKKKTVGPLIKALALKFKGRLVFGQGHEKDKKLVEKYFAHQYPSLYVLPPHGMPPVLYEGPLNSRALSKFFRRFFPKKLPEDEDDEAEATLPEIHDQSCFDHYCGRGNSLCVMLVQYKEDSDTTHFDTMKTVEESRDDSLFSFVWIDSEKHKDWLHASFGVEAQSHPQVVVVSAKKHRFAQYVGSFNVKNLAQFLNFILSGKQGTYPVDSQQLGPLEQGKQQCAHMKPPPASGSSQQQAHEQPQPKQKGSAAKEVVGSQNLTSASFDELVMQSTSPWMVLFAAPAAQCPTCAPMDAEWLEAAQKTRGMVKFGRVDCSVEEGLAKRFSVTGFPTVKVFSGGVKTTSSVTDFADERTATTLLKHALALLEDKHVTSLSVPSFGPWLNEDPELRRVILFTNKRTVPDLYKALSMAFEGRLKFGLVSSDEANLVAQFKVAKFPTVMFMGSPAEAAAAKQQGLTAQRYDGPLSYGAISSVLKQMAADKARAATGKESVPTVHKVHSQQDLEKYCLSRGGLCAVTMLSPDALKEPSFAAVQEQLAARYLKKPLHFLQVERYPNMAFHNAWGVSADGPASLVLLSPKKKRFAAFVGVYDEEHVVEFLDAVFSGRLRTSSYTSFPEIVESSSRSSKEDL